MNTIVPANTLLPYASLVSGFALLLVAVECFLLRVRKAAHTPPWGWLCAATGAFGIAEWLAASDYLTGGFAWSAGGRDIFVIASFLCLLEFDRRALVFFRRSPGRGYWLFVLVLLIPAGALFGDAGVGTTTRYAVGVPALAAAAWFFYTLSHGRPRAQAIWPAVLSGSLAAAALSVMLPPSDLPVAVLRTALALLLAIAVAGHSQRTSRRKMVTLPYVVGGAIAALALSHALGFVYVTHALQEARADAAWYGESQAQRLSHTIHKNLDSLHSLVSWATAEDAENHLNEDIARYPDGELGVFIRVAQNPTSASLVQISFTPRTGGDTFVFSPNAGNGAPAVVLPTDLPEPPNATAQTSDESRMAVGPIAETLDHRQVLWARETIGEGTPPWGVGSVAIDFTAAAQAAGILDPGGPYRQTLRGPDGATVLGSANVSAESRPVVIPLDLGGMPVSLEISPQTSWGAQIAGDLAMVVLLGTLLVIAAAAAAHMLASRYLQSARASLRERETLQAVLLQARDGFAMVDPGGNLVFTNPALERMTGRSSAELNEVGLLDELLATGDSGRLEIALPEGDVRWVSVGLSRLQVDGEPHMLVSARDITEQNRQDRERAAILEAIQDNLFLMDPDHRILWTNATQGPCMGSEGPSGRCYALSAGLSPCPACPVVRAFSTAAPAAGEIAIQGDRDELTWEVHAAGVTFGREAQAVVVSARDITPRIALEDRLRQSQKMEAVGQLAGGIAHDFNNILTGILGTADLIVNETDLDDRSHADASEIKRLGLQASSLVGQLLAFSRARPLELQPVDLAVVITKIRTLLLRVIGEHIRLDVHVSGPKAWVKADPAQLEQVLLNLAVNARDAMADGGRLEISLSLDPAAGISEPTAALDPEDISQALVPQAVLVVKDNGCGMDAHTLSRAFEPFFTTKSVGKGTGIGLANVYGIVDQLGGHIRVSSTVGTGTTFVITLPLLADPPTAPGEGGTAAPIADDGVNLTPRRGARRILVVEDETHIRGLMQRLLVGAGHDVTLSDRPDDALAQVHACRERGEKPFDLLITDIMMPGMQGTELAARMRRQQSSLQVILMSGYSGPSNTIVGESGVTFLPKPFTIDELLQAVTAGPQPAPPAAADTGQRRNPHSST